MISKILFWDNKKEFLSLTITKDDFYYSNKLTVSDKKALEGDRKDCCQLSCTSKFLSFNSIIFKMECLWFCYVRAQAS